MNVSVETNRGAYIGSVKKAAVAASKPVAEFLLSEGRDKTPDDGEHDLRDAERINQTDTGSELEVEKPHAGYQWFGMRSDGTHVVKNYTTPGTGTMWWEKVAMENPDKIQKIAQNAFTEALK